jgi:Zn-dependent metalloprotease
MARKQSDTATGTIFLIEYYDGIRVAGSYVYVAFEKGIVSCINFNAAGIASPRVENKKPKYTFNEALQNYLAIKKEVPKDDVGKGELIYILKNNTYPPTLALCWSFTIFFRANSFNVKINAATGELEREGGGQKQAQNISGHIY